MDIKKNKTDEDMKEGRTLFDAAETASKYNNPFAGAPYPKRKRMGYYREGKQRPYIYINDGSSYRFMFGAKASLAIAAQGFERPKAVLHRDDVTGALFVVVGQDGQFPYAVHKSKSDTSAKFENRDVVTGIIQYLGLNADEHGRYHFAISDDVSRCPERCVFLISRP